MTEKSNQLIEFEHLYSGVLSSDSVSKVEGHRVFRQDGNFVGLYDKRYDTVWQIDVKTLQFLK